MCEMNERDMFAALEKLAAVQPQDQSVQRAKSRVREALAKEFTEAFSAASGFEPAPPRRKIMHWNRLKWAIPVAAAAAILLVVGLWPGGGRGGAGSVFAACLQQLRAGSYAFDVDVRTGHGAGTSLKGMVLEPGRLRLEDRAERVASIIDVDRKRSLILLDRTKVAHCFNSKEEPGVGSLGFLVLPGRLIEDLWSLHAGDETALGTGLVDGKPAEGFRVTRPEHGGTETITVWADRKTGYPLKVDVVLQSGTQGEPAMEQTLKNFAAVAAPDPALFSTEIPEGFTLANQTTLEQFLSQADPASPATGGTSAEAEKILKALALDLKALAQEPVVGGDRKAAAEVLLTVDWNGDVRFAREHYTFTMTEKQYMGLVLADQQKVIDPIMGQSAHCKYLARELVELGRQARAAKDPARAEQYLQAAVHFGEILNRADAMLHVRMTGIVMQQSALKEMLVLHEETGQSEKAGKVRGQLEDLADQRAKIIAGLTGK